MTGHLMNPVNRQHFNRANLFGHTGMIGIHGCEAGWRNTIFQGVATGIIRYPVISNFAVVQVSETNKQQTSSSPEISIKNKGFKIPPIWPWHVQYVVV